MNTKIHPLQIGFNALGFQSAWWLSVLGIVVGHPWLGPLAMTFYLVADHISLNKRSAETVTILSAAAIGTIADSIMSNLGLIAYAGGYASLPQLAPLWITAMWAGFAATLGYSLSWLKPRLWAAILLGAIFGPLSYLAGQKFGALELVSEWSIPALVIFWGLAVPGLVKLHDMIRGE